MRVSVRTPSIPGKSDIWSPSEDDEEEGEEEKAATGILPVTAESVEDLVEEEGEVVVALATPDGEEAEQGGRGRTRSARAGVVLTRMRTFSESTILHERWRQVLHHQLRYSDCGSLARPRPLPFLVIKRRLRSTKGERFIASIVREISRPTLNFIVRAARRR